MLSQLIQRQIPIGSKVCFTLKNGDKVSGTLIELGRDHVTLESNAASATVLIEMIGAWQVEQEKSTVADSMISTPQDNGNPVTLLKPENQVPTVPVSPQAMIDSEVLKKLIEIEERFKAQIQVATISLRKPDFAFSESEFRGKYSAEAQTVWDRVRNKYAYAEKMKELSAQFGRIRPLVDELTTLSNRFPNSQSLKRHLAFLQWLSGDQREAISTWKNVALQTKEAKDWYNLAAAAWADGQSELACYGLEQFFRQTSLTESPEVWYLYVKLLVEYKNYSALVATINREPKLTEKEREVLLESAIYPLLETRQKDFAMDLVQRSYAKQSLQGLFLEACSHLDAQPVESYQKLAAELNAQTTEKSPSKEKILLHQPQGFVYTYKRERNFGFLKGVDGEEYFFHRSAISDDELLNDVVLLKSGERIPVVFEPAQGPKGLLAIGITLYRTIEEMFNRATEYANDGEYPKAIAQIKRVLDLDADYPSAREMYEKWREYARATGIPRGSNLYARAKRVQLIEKDLDRATQLLRQAIAQGDSVESAVKDLAALLDQRGKPEEAIQVLLKHRNKIQDQKSVDNMLIGFYQNAGKYDEAIALLQKKWEQATSEGIKVQILGQIANNYLRKEDYVQAEQTFRSVLQKQPDNRSIERHIAICLFKQGRYDDAENLLNKILSTSPDAHAAEILEAIRQARLGQLPQIDEIIIETTLSDFSREISGFAQFFLDRSDFQGVPPDRVQRKSFNHADIQKLEELATKLGTRRPRDRADYYLSAAKMVSLLEDEDPNQFYKYLCRSFASQGDSIVIENRPLDSAREFYCEALNVYAGDRSGSGEEQDARNALVRFLFASMGPAHVPIKPSIPSIDETLEIVLSRHPERSKVFEYIAYLIFRSLYAANRVLNRLYHKSSLQAMALEYLREKDIHAAPVNKLSDFVSLWNELNRKILDENRLISNELRFLAKVELTTASLSNSIERTKSLGARLFFDLDQQRVNNLQKILEMAFELCKQVAFEEQERLCIQIGDRCQDLLQEIEDSPTKLSVEEMYPVIEAIQKKVRSRLEELYESSIPKLDLRLPVESYTPDHGLRVEAQVVVSNRIGCSPAEALELIVQEYEDSFVVPLDGSLRGGDQQILRVPIQITEGSLRSLAFSLPVYAQYRTRSGEINQTPVKNFAIRLSSEKDFVEIENPYAAYAEGGIVGDPTMFYGREELIANVAKTIRESRSQSKCVVIYGQKRAGKSSLLHHLEQDLKTDKNLLILNLGSIGSVLDEHASYPFLYQFLFSILKKLEYAIEDRARDCGSDLDMRLPSDKEFYSAPSPLVLFKDTLEQFRRTTSRMTNWRDVRLVLLIDEFSYLYGYITQGRIPESFMKNWKALLQENYFNAVLAGQDVMPKFKQRFPNEFGTTQDERVTYLKHDDAVRLIDEPIRIGGRQGTSRYREKATDRIIDLTAGSPFYIQILCNRLVEYMNRKRASLVTEADVEQVKDELIRGANALTLDKFDNLINSGDTSADAISDKDALQVLTAIAMNSRTGPCSRHNITCETDTSLDTILDDLVKRDVVERERGIYYLIRVGLFKEWLIAHP